ncbi:hypothetical protein OROMI_013390 [Orobanche minor]
MPIEVLLGAPFTRNASGRSATWKKQKNVTHFGWGARFTTDMLRCDLGCLEPGLVRERIVICNDYYGVPRAFGAGAHVTVATLHSFPKDLAFPVDFSQVVPLAASRLDEQDFHNVRSCLESTKSILDILKSEYVRNVDAPKVAGFSSRGPNTTLQDILKVLF